MKQKPLTSRRRFLKHAAAISAAAFSAPAFLEARAPNEKLNVAGIGVGGQGAGDLRQAAATETIVALADVDSNRAAGTFRSYEKASKYTDFRKMLDKEARGIDAVIIATPDHMHATCALWCMQLGKHVYVEKPLTRTPWEARLLTQAAAPVSWSKEVGKGRVFYTSLGHREDIWDPAWKDRDGARKNSPEVSVAFQTHLLDQIRWALRIDPRVGKP